MLHKLCDLKFKQNITIVFPYTNNIQYKHSIVLYKHSKMRWLAEAFVVAVLNQTDHFDYFH